MDIIKYCLLLLTTIVALAESAGVIQAFVEGIVGSPLFHKTQNVKFDPDVAKRRNPEFEAINGHLSVDLIERFGLGMDGRQAERLQQQRQRDAYLYANNYNNYNYR